MFHFHTYLGKCHQLVFCTNSWGFFWESCFPTAGFTLVLSSIPPGIERSQGQKSRLLFQSVKIFQTLRFHFDGKTHTILRWISCGFHGFSLFGNRCSGWKSLSMGEGERESQTHFWVTCRRFFWRSFKNLRKATWRFARGKRGKNITNLIKTMICWICLRWATFKPLMPLHDTDQFIGILTTGSL